MGVTLTDLYAGFVLLPFVSMHHPFTRVPGRLRAKDGSGTGLQSPPTPSPLARGRPVHGCVADANECP